MINIGVNKLYCVCYYFPNKKDYYYKDNNKPISKDDWIYAFVKWPNNREELINYYVKLQGNEIIYVLDAQIYDDESYIITFLTDKLQKLYLLISRDFEILDPVTLTTFSKLVELDEVKNERLDD